MRRAATFLAQPPTWFAALVLAAAVGVVFAPARNRIFIHDQLAYFAELGGRTSLADGLSYYDYGAVRVFDKGDEIAFRPMVFGLLAVENRLFTYHVVPWNVVSLVLHACAGLGLFHLLRTIRRSAAALPAALLFVVLAAPMELVTWNHLGGYLLAWTLLAVALAAVVRLLRRPAGASAWRDAVIASAAFTIAGLGHETVPAMATIAAATIVVCERRRTDRLRLAHVALLAAPAIVFAAGYAVHLSHLSAIHTQSSVSGPPEAAAVVRAVPQAFLAIGGWVLELTMPVSLHLRAHHHAFLSSLFRFSPDSAAEVLGAGLAIGLAIALGCTVSRAALRRGAAPLAVLGLCLVAYAVLIVSGRSLQEAFSLRYYLYPAGLLMIAIGYALVDGARASGGRAVALAGAMAVFAAVNAVIAGRTARAIEAVNAEPAAYLDAVTAFVDAHRHEADFTFAIAGRPGGLDPVEPLPVGYPDDPGVIVIRPYLTEILFKRYYRTDHPKYVYVPPAVSPAPR